jgi:hypothetical protein
MLGFGLMKKLIGKVISLMFLLAIVGVLLFVFSPAKMIRKGITSYGPKVTKTTIEMSEIDVSWFSGRGTIKGLNLGNPEGFKAESAIEIPVATIAIRPTTVFKEKLVIKSIEIEAPFITYEGQMSGSNLSQIQENIDEFVGKVKGLAGQSTEGEKKPSGGKKLQVDEIVIRNAKVKIALTLLGGKGANISLPEIRLAGLGQGEGGITGPEVLKSVWNALVKATTEKVTGIAGGIGEGAVRVGESILKGVGDMLKGDPKK